MSRFYNTGDNLCDKRNVPKEATYRSDLVVDCAAY